MPIARSKTIAYYIYHLVRIEDIVTNTLIEGKTQLFFSSDYLLNFPVITTGNEIKRDDLIEFSKMLDIAHLKKYAADVFAGTNEIIHNMSFKDSKTKVSAERKANLLTTKTVSDDENAFWLVDYWCKKTYAGLLFMPLSRHHKPCTTVAPCWHVSTWFQMLK
ncbi:MAG: hypothetical protein FWB91_13470 [Defluviitaleaceae bacterium]|nr:hypothetical protein [Defluviitaleaceae bacterium]